MILKYENLIEKLSDKYFAHSCVNKEDTLADIMSKIKPKPKTIVELGTYFGVSTAILASICDVYTFDVKRYHEADVVWKELGVRGNIYQYIIEDSTVTQFIMEGKYYDFAFIDSVHDYDNAKIDFEVVERCGRVLFHDNNDRFPGVSKFCEEIGCKKIGDFGYWEAK